MTRESLIQKAILNYLQLKENLGQLYFFRSGAGAVRVHSPGGRDRVFKSGKAGCPDITVCKDGKFIGLEVKNETGKQSEKQLAAQKIIEGVGGHYYIVRSVEDVINLGI